MMMESRNFLVPDATFAIEMVAFLVVLVVMTRFVVPRIRAGMQARQDAINQALAAARDAEVRRATAEAQSEAIRATARREARTIIEQARRMRDQMIADGRRAGIEEYRWESARTERELRRRTEAAMSQLRMRARTAALLALNAYLGDADVDTAKLERLLDQSVGADTASRSIAAA